MRQGYIFGNLGHHFSFWRHHWSKNPYCFDYVIRIGRLRLLIRYEGKRK